MGSCRSRLMLGAWVVWAVTASFAVARSASAQPRPDTPAAKGASSLATARKLVEQGIAAYNARDYGTAISFYLRAFAIEPHPRLLFDVGQALRLAGCHERAVSFYERYLALEPKGGESEAARGALAQLQGGKPAGSSTGKSSGVSEACSVVDGLGDSQQASPFAAKGRLRLRSTPGGMSVMLDGVKIGATPVEHEVAAGAHMVSLVHRGRLVGEQKVEVAEDAVVEATIPVSLASEGDGRSRLAPVLLWVGGGMALVGSGVAFYLGQQGGKGHPEDPYVYAGATPTGGVLVGVGAAAIGVGVWLWVRGSKEAAPVVAVRSGGGYLGWQGRF